MGSKRQESREGNSLKGREALGWESDDESAGCIHFWKKKTTPTDLVIGK